MKVRQSKSRAITTPMPSRQPVPRFSWPGPYGRLATLLERAGVSRMRLVLPNGTEHALGRQREEVPIPRVRLHRARGLMRGWLGGLVGWAEGYINQDWSCDDPVALTDWAIANEQALESAFPGSLWTRLLNRLYHRLRDNTRHGSKRNIAYHYDLGNSFYHAWLDETMTYSSALFRYDQESLACAQLNKYHRVLELLQVQEGDRVLEIGCGWGGFGEVLLANHNCSWHGITLSREQYEWTHTRLHPFAERAKAALTDYRDLEGRYDRIVSIEMLEAVGEDHWPRYFKALRDHLKPGGTAVLQVITIDDQRFHHYRRNPDFIQRYVFPGGMLPSPSIMREQIARAGLSLIHEEGFGADYARTLSHWHNRFMAAWPMIAPMGFDGRFFRLWRYYLAYCESGFKSGAIDVRFYKIRADG